MRAGKLDQRVVIQRQDEGADEVGQRVLAWTTFDEVWANVNLQNGKGSVTSGREVSVLTGSIRIRVRSDVIPEMRVLWRDHVFDIKAVIPRPDGLRDCMDLVVETGENNG